MTFQEKIALEMLAKGMLEYRYRNYSDGSSWESAGAKTRNAYRERAYNYLKESFYSTNDS